MVGDYMNDVREIVLYFKEGCPLVPVDIAKGISDRFKEIGSPVVLTPETNSNQPLVIFKENTEMMLTVGQMTVNMVVQEKYFEKLDTIIFDLVDLFNDLKIEFVNIGVIYSLFFSEKHKELCMNKFLNVENLPNDFEEFNLAFFQKIKYKKDYLNCWERLVTNSEHFNELLVQFDINCLAIEKVDIDMKFIKEFLKIIDEHIEERIDF
jgi:hypothetical protein